MRCYSYLPESECRLPPSCPSRLPICNAAKGNWDSLLVYGPSRSLSESMRRIQPCSLAAATCPPPSPSALAWPPGIGASGVQMLPPNVNPCLNDIVNLDGCYSNWLTGGSRESDPSRLTFLVADTYRCYFLFSVVTMLSEALQNHYRLITTIVTGAEVPSGRVVEDAHRRLFVLRICQEKKEAKVKENMTINFAATHCVFTQLESIFTVRLRDKIAI